LELEQRKSKSKGGLNPKEELNQELVRMNLKTPQICTKTQVILPANALACICMCLRGVVKTGSGGLRERKTD